MPFIGQQPVTGAYHKLDAITASATATYNLLLNGVAYSPASANHLLVSLNGVMQAPQDSFTVSGSTITFASALTSSDNIDFIMALGDVLNIGTPSDGTVTDAKIASGAVTDTKIVGMSSSKLTGALPAIDGSALTGISAGVLQTVSTTKSDTFSTTSGQASPAAISGLTATITPVSTSSKILVMYNVNYGFDGTATTVGIRLKRGSTAIGIGNADGNRARMTAQGHGEGSSWHGDVLAGTYLDSPSTTSATTYGIDLGQNGGGVTVYVNRTGRDANTANEDSRAVSTITLMEIEG